jgi:hypothetical protein
MTANWPSAAKKSSIASAGTIPSNTRVPRADLRITTDLTVQLRRVRDRRPGTLQHLQRYERHATWDSSRCPMERGSAES